MEGYSCLISDIWSNQRVVYNQLHHFKMNNVINSQLNHFIKPFFIVAGADYTESHCKDKKQAIVHLFEWSWDSIANECINVRKQIKSFKKSKETY